MKRAVCASEIRRVRWDVSAIGPATRSLTRGVGLCENTGRNLSFNVIEPLARAIGLSAHAAPMPLFELDLPRRDPHRVRS